MKLSVRGGRSSEASWNAESQQGGELKESGSRVEAVVSYHPAEVPEFARGDNLVSSM